MLHLVGAPLPEVPRAPHMVVPAQPIVLPPVVSSQSWRYFVSLARCTRQGAVTFGQSIDSTRGCAVVFEMESDE